MYVISARSMVKVAEYDDADAQALTLRTLKCQDLQQITNEIKDSQFNSPTLHILSYNFLFSFISYPKRDMATLDSLD